MTNAYNPETWHDFFVMLGGSVAALTGLLFVATSIHINGIAKLPHWRLQALGNTLALIGLLTEASVVLIPQKNFALGVELIIGNLFLLFIPILMFVYLYRLRANIYTLGLVSGMFAWILGILGGASLIVEAGPGMYLVVASCLSIIWLCMLNAWALMTASHQTSATVKPSSNKIRSGKRADSPRL